jgi:hypothetical protein
MRLAIIGNKEYADFLLMKEILCKENSVSLIVSGGAPGADTLAKRYASEKKIQFLEFPPDYIQNGRTAKQIRNRKIVDNCDKIIAFWNGKCKSTAYTLQYARKIGKEILVISFH